MAKYFILYANKPKLIEIHQTDVEKPSQQEAEEWFNRYYSLGSLLGVRKGRGFTQSEINSKKKSLKYAQ